MANQLSWERESDDLIHEEDLLAPTLKLLAEAPDGFLKTADLISKLEQTLVPTGKDAEILQGRNDSYFSQKVRNLISHRESPSSPINKGWVSYDEVRHGLKITDVGRRVSAS